jgi:hypothetical protein
MRVIGPLQGIAAYRQPPEEYQPETGVLPHDMIELIKTAYGFHVFPQLLPNTPLPATNEFQAGRFSANGSTFVISRLIMTADGDIAIATKTEQADLFIDDLVRLLDENLGFRLRMGKLTKSFVSNVVVEFDSGLEEYLEPLSKMIVAINDARSGRSPFNIKRLAFGEPDISPPPTDLLVIIERTDFVIERRAGRPFEENRYFCSAPMATEVHIRTLERIEAIARRDTD